MEIQHIFLATKDNLKLFKELFPETYVGVFSLYNEFSEFYTAQSWTDLHREICNYRKNVGHNPDFARAGLNYRVWVKIHKMWLVSEFQDMIKGLKMSPNAAMNQIEKECVNENISDGYISANRSHTGEIISDRQRVERKNKEREKELKERKNKKLSKASISVNRYKLIKSKKGKFKKRLIRSYPSIAIAKLDSNDNIGIALKVPLWHQFEKENFVLVADSLWDYAEEATGTRRDKKFFKSENHRLYEKCCREKKSFYSAMHSSKGHKR